MKSKKGERPYVTPETQKRVELFSRGYGFSNKEAYHQLITSALDENGIPRTVINLTEPQRKAIEEIAKEMGQRPEQTVQDLINFSMLIYATPVTFREMFVYASPLLMDRLVQYNPGIAKQILRGLKKFQNIEK